MESIQLGRQQLEMKVLSETWAGLCDQPGQETRDVNIVVHSDRKYQEIEGIGGAFSEIGSKALFSLKKEDREGIMEQLFDEKEGAGFNYCRLPIGASDFGLKAYSLNDNEGDFAMEKFSLDRDLEYLIPYIKLAKVYGPELRIHASPWSPPAWLKDTKSMTDGGSLINSDEVHHAYALYFSKYIEGYGEAGIEIDRLMVQNEPDAKTIYPSCIMGEDQMTQLLLGHIKPVFKERGIKTKLCAGTFRTVTGLPANKCMADKTLMDEIDGIGIQYCLERYLGDLSKIRPDKKIIHTESVCYNGDNSWEQAIKLFNDFVVYMNAGCSVYTYWNMILDHSGKSTWGWRQNSLVTINEATGEFTYNPDFYVMKLIGSHLKTGARRIESFSFHKRAIAFENPDKSILVFVSNMNDQKEKGKMVIDGQEKVVELPAQSLTCFRF